MAGKLDLNSLRNENASQITAVVNTNKHQASDRATADSAVLKQDKIFEVTTETSTITLDFEDTPNITLDSTVLGFSTLTVDVENLGNAELVRLSIIKVSGQPIIFGNSFDLIDVSDELLNGITVATDINLAVSNYHSVVKLIEVEMLHASKGEVETSQSTADNALDEAFFASDGAAESLSIHDHRYETLKDVNGVISGSLPFVHTNGQVHHAKLISTDSAESLLLTNNSDQQFSTNRTTQGEPFEGELNFQDSITPPNTTLFEKAGNGIKINSIADLEVTIETKLIVSTLRVNESKPINSATVELQRFRGGNSTHITTYPIDSMALETFTITESHTISEINGFLNGEDNTMPGDIFILFYTEGFSDSSSAKMVFEQFTSQFSGIDANKTSLKIPNEYQEIRQLHIKVDLNGTLIKVIGTDNNISVTKIATGFYEIFHNINIPQDEYAVQTTVNMGVAGGLSGISRFSAYSDPTNNSVEITTYSSNGTPTGGFDFDISISY